MWLSYNYNQKNYYLFTALRLCVIYKEYTKGKSRIGLVCKFILSAEFDCKQLDA